MKIYFSFTQNVRLCIWIGAMGYKAIVNIATAVLSRFALNWAQRYEYTKQVDSLDSLPLFTHAT